jgi:glycosyltransferase involved in cell wall biosynthesis
MKIMVLVRTRNEEQNIERFCLSYPWADKILVADGGSTDNTKEIAKSFYNVEVKDFTERIERNGLWRNPHGKHINFLIDWAEREKADWVIFDDCDCVPNFKLKSNIRSIIEETSQWYKNFIYVTRLYVWGRNKYFEKMSVQKGKYTPSLYAWRVSHLRAKEDDPWSHSFSYDPNAGEIETLMPPFCLLHYFALSEEVETKKREFYINIEQYPGLLPHHQTYGNPVKLPEWAKL